MESTMPPNHEYSRAVFPERLLNQQLQNRRSLICAMQINTKILLSNTRTHYGLVLFVVVVYTSKIKSPRTSMF